MAVRVVNVCLRHPFLLAAELAVAQAVSEGRLDVGLGAGSLGLARYDHDALGIPFPAFEQRIARLDAACRVLPALWRSEAVDDESLGLLGASLGPVDISVPPLTVGGESTSVMRIAARYADAWNLSTPDPGAFTKGRQDLERECKEEGRLSRILTEAQLWVRDLWTDARLHVRAFQDAGVDTVILVLDEERGPDEVRRLADRVL